VNRNFFVPKTTKQIKKTPKTRGGKGGRSPKISERAIARIRGNPLLRAF